MKNIVDVTANRQARKWTRKEQLGRVLWTFGSLLFQLSPRPCWGWRRLLLRAFGAHVADGVHIYPSVRVSIPWNLSLGEQCAVGDRAILYALGPISIGARATVSQGAHLCAGSHDITKLSRPLIRPPITIEEDTWIAADAFIGPGVKVGAEAIVGARAVVMSEVPPQSIVVGNPAHVLRSIPPAS